MNNCCQYRGKYPTDNKQSLFHKVKSSSYDLVVSIGYIMGMYEKIDYIDNKKNKYIVVEILHVSVV